MEEVRELVQSAVKQTIGQDITPELIRPDEQFGDYATNVALQLAKKLGQKPREVAEKIVHALPNDSTIAKAEIAGPGFINLTLTDSALIKAMGRSPSQSLAGKVVVAEYSDPNPFKVLHAGHLYTSIVGDAVANLLEVAGAKVHRVNFGGDVGLHVGKTMWAILSDLSNGIGEDPLAKLEAIPKNARSEWMAQCYVKGTNAYEDNVQAKIDINLLNKMVYDIHFKNDKEDIVYKSSHGLKIDSDQLAQIYKTCRDWSYDYFNEFYKSIGSEFDKYYRESEVAELGIKTVKDHIEKGIFEESEGAIVFKGEPYGLHTRVFINSEGLPTYEAKDIGLIMSKKQKYNFDLSVVITGNEQEQYMAVVLKAIEQFAPDLTKATRHLTHGMVKLKGGVKMSSRKGNILTAVYVLDVAEEASKKVRGVSDWDTVLGAVKYAFLKQRTGGDIIYDPEESVSIEGNSGPYLQYAYARARSILRKAGEYKAIPLDSLEAGERSLVRKISEYPEVIEKAAAELMPHHVATYLYELAQEFNRFYEKNRVVGNDREAIRLQLVQAYSDALRSGLAVLHIPAPEKM